MKGFIIFASILAVASMGFLAGPFSPPLSGPENFLNCNVIVEAGPGAQLCEPGIEAPLTATVTGDYLSIAWTPADAVADPTSLNTTAVVEQTTTFTITARAVSDENLIVNGDFSLNDTTTFSSDYIYGTGGGVGLLSNEGQYAIAANAGSTHNHFANCSDHTGGGNMMVVNASGELNNVWCQTVQITPNTDYSFSAWVTSVVSQNPARLQFSINGGLLGSVFQASPITCNWNQFAEFWNSGSATTAEICIVNVNLTPAGNDFALDDIVFSPVCEITDELTVTVIDLNPSWVSPGDLCSDAPAIALDNLLTVESTPGGQWSIDGVPASTFDPSALSPGPHTVRYVLTLEDCIFEDIQTISVFTAPNSGQTLDAYMICSGESATVNLADLLAGEDTGGIWTEVSAVPSTGGAFNSGAGTFATTGQNAGIYDFEYRIAGQGPCADATTTVSVMLHETPVADAGEDKAVDCDVSEATLGGPATSIGGNLSYEWIALNGSPIGQPDTRFITVDQPDTYVFTVTNIDNGCRSTDEVVLTSNIAEISAEALVSQVSCGGTNDGAIAVGPVSGGQDPYTFSINGGPFITQPQFTGLAPGAYTVAVMDVNGCETSLDLTLEAPAEVQVMLDAQTGGNPPVINLGDSLLLRVLVNIPQQNIDAVVWKPQIPGCDECLETYVRPGATETYSVTVFDINGCSGSALLTVFVEQRFNIFIPNAFSPNDDGINDLFMIQAGNEVESVISFNILDRWGNLVFQSADFQPNDPLHAWNGKVKGRRANPGVFAFFAEIKMKSGQIIIEKGEVNLLY
jgi:gliding motility-associated-like protein